MLKIKLILVPLKRAYPPECEVENSTSPHSLFLLKEASLCGKQNLQSGIMGIVKKFSLTILYKEENFFQTEQYVFRHLYLRLSFVPFHKCWQKSNYASGSLSKQLVTFFEVFFKPFP